MDQNGSRRAAITQAARLLTHPSPKPLSPSPIDEIPSSDSDATPPEPALSTLTHLATGRNPNPSQAPLRTVLSAGPEPTHPVSLDRPTSHNHNDIMSRLLHTLSASQTIPTPTFPTLQKKIARLSTSNKALPAPLPAPVAARVQRTVAYEGAKHAITENWASTVANNRKARMLTFPRNAPGSDKGRQAADLVNGFRPANEYEREIDAMLREAGVAADHSVINAEQKELADQLEAAPVTKEEVLQRTRELARVRSLAFQYERKMKRIKKIKSRKYRRILKREKERLHDMAESHDPEDVQQAAITAERKRVEERMTLRHKNTSKWVRRQLIRSETRRNADTRAAVEEQLALHQKLKQRQEAEIGSSDSEEEEERTEAEVNIELEQMRAELEGRVEEEEVPKKKKGVMGMRFMQAAQERKRKEALALLDQMPQELDSGTEGDDEEADAAPVGRQTFSGTVLKEGGKKGVPRAGGDAALSDDERVGGEDGDEEEELKRRVVKEYEQGAEDGAAVVVNAAAGRISDIVKEVGGTKAGFTTSLVGRLNADGARSGLNNVVSGPERADVVEDGAVKREGENGGSDGGVDAGNPWLSGLTDGDGKGGRERRGKGVSIKVMGAADAHEPKTATKKRRVQFAGAGSKDDGVSQADRDGKQDSDGDGEEDDMARMSLVAKAFEGIGGADEAEFKASKEANVMESLPSAKDIGAEVLPGWGSWDGAGMKKRKKERAESAFARAARERLEAARSKAIGKRKDRNLAHVVLDERRVKQAAELTLSSVPFPFTSIQQWQRELDTPVCKELVSGNAFSAGVAPRVRKKVGVVIEPLRHGELNKGGKRRKIEERVRVEREERNGGKRRRVGKAGVIDLRKELAEKRNAARKGLLL